MCSSHRETQAAQVAHALDRLRIALRKGQEVHAVTERGERADQVKDGERCAPHLEERLRGEEQDAEPLSHPGSSATARPGAQSPRSLSASIAAMHPVPAAVTAWR